MCEALCKQAQSYPLPFKPQWFLQVTVLQNAAEPRHGSRCSLGVTVHPWWHWWIWLLRGQIHVLIGIGVALQAVSSPSYQLGGYNCIVNAVCEGDGYARLCSLTAGMCGARHPLIRHQEGLLHWTASLKSKCSIPLKVGAGRGELEETK